MSARQLCVSYILYCVQKLKFKHIYCHHLSETLYLLQHVWDKTTKVLSSPHIFRAVDRKKKLANHKGLWSYISLAECASSSTNGVCVVVFLHMTMVSFCLYLICEVCLLVLIEISTDQIRFFFNYPLVTFLSIVLIVLLSLISLFLSLRLPVSRVFARLGPLWWSMTMAIRSGCRPALDPRHSAESRSITTPPPMPSG